MLGNYLWSQGGTVTGGKQKLGTRQKNNWISFTQGLANSLRVCAFECPFTVD